MADETPAPKKAKRPSQRLYVPEERKEQAALVMARRLSGKTIKQIAEEFECTSWKIDRRLEQARREQLYGRAREIVAGELIPLAIEVYKDVLANGDETTAATLAQHVLMGTGVLPKMALPENLNGGALTFEAWRAKWTLEREQVLPAAPATIDVQVTPDV